MQDVTLSSFGSIMATVTFPFIDSLRTLVTIISNGALLVFVTIKIFDSLSLYCYILGKMDCFIAMLLFLITAYLWVMLLFSHIGSFIKNVTSCICYCYLRWFTLRNCYFLAS